MADNNFKDFLKDSFLIEAVKLISNENFYIVFVNWYKLDCSMYLIKWNGIIIRLSYEGGVSGLSLKNIKFEPIKKIIITNSYTRSHHTSFFVEFFSINYGPMSIPSGPARSIIKLNNVVMGAL